MRKLLICSIAMAGAMLVASEAKAGLLVQYSVNGAPLATLCSAPSGSACANSITVAGVALTIQSGISNSPGTPSLADVLSSAVQIQNTGGSPATLSLVIGDTGFMSPTGGVTLLSHIGDTVVTGSAANLLSYNSCVDVTNAQNSCPGTYHTPTQNPVITNVGSDSNDQSLAIANLVAPFSITEKLNFTLGAGTILNYSASTSLVPVPEPASLTLFGTALAGLAAKIRRRRKGAAQ